LRGALATKQSQLNSEIAALAFGKFAMTEKKNCG